MAEPERYGVNIVAAQVEDPLVQEAFRDQERVNAELKAKINSMSAQISSLRTMIQELAETLSIYIEEAE